MLKDSRFVIVDIDGTLFDSEKRYRKILRKVLNSNPNSFLSQFYFATLEGNRPGSIFGLREKLNNLTYVFFEKIDTKRPELFRGAREFLEKLREDEIKIFASTGSTIKRAERMMKGAKIFSFFELVLGRELPKAKHISIFANHLGLSIAKFSFNALYLGDEPIDMILAKRFGIYRIGITNTFDAEMLKKFGAEKVINNFEELIEL